MSWRAADYRRSIRGMEFVPVPKLPELGFSERFTELVTAGFPGAGRRAVGRPRPRARSATWAAPCRGVAQELERSGQAQIQFTSSPPPPHGCVFDALPGTASTGYMGNFRWRCRRPPRASDFRCDVAGHARDQEQDRRGDLRWLGDVPERSVLFVGASSLVAEDLREAGCPDVRFGRDGSATGSRGRTRPAAERPRRARLWPCCRRSCGRRRRSSGTPRNRGEASARDTPSISGSASRMISMMAERCRTAGFLISSVIWVATVPRHGRLFLRGRPCAGSCANRSGLRSPPGLSAAAWCAAGPVLALARVRPLHRRAQTAPGRGRADDLRAVGHQGGADLPPEPPWLCSERWRGRRPAAVVRG